MTSQFSADDPVAELIVTFNELNSSVIEELDQEPSPLEFMRYVARNTPFVVRGAAVGWEAFKKWDARFLNETLAGRKVNVAVTPLGQDSSQPPHDSPANISSNADAPTPLPDGTLSLSKPHEEDQPFDEFLSNIIRQTKQSQDPKEPSEEVLYAQTQNDNLRNEYAPLFALNHLPASIPFARIALAQQHPDALNLWIGNERAVTALHKDNYENIYVQLRGRKRFLLLPPLCQPCVAERSLRAATYHRRGPDESTSDSSDGALRLEPDEGADDVPFATWDPDEPETNATPYSHLADPMEVILEPGDMLYLPAMWYHKVSQFCTPQDEGFVLAVNYWYDMEFSGPLYPMTSFVRSFGLRDQAKAASQA